MNANAFRHLFDYHIAENRKLWGEYIVHLDFEKFILDPEYSHGSVRNQIVHLMSVDDVWFSELRDVKPLESFPQSSGDDRQEIRTYWDQVEQRMQVYLAGLQDDMLFTKPITDPEEDKVLMVWQVLQYVITHATDHRAQILRLLHDMGVKTKYQDYIFYAYEHAM